MINKIKLIKVKNKNKNLLKIFVDKMNNSYSSKKNKRFYNLRYRNRYLIWANGMIVGTISINKTLNPKHIWEFYIDEKFRRKHIGSDVLDFLIKNNKNYTLGVYKNNYDSFRLYDKFGFQVYKEDFEMLWMCRYSF